MLRRDDPHLSERGDVMRRRRAQTISSEDDLDLATHVGEMPGSAEAPTAVVSSSGKNRDCSIGSEPVG